MSLRPSERTTSSWRPPGPSTSSAGARLRSAPRRTSPWPGPTRRSRSTTRASGRSRNITDGSGRRSRGILDGRGVSLHPGHRAIVPTGFDLDRITTDPVAFSTGQPDAPADATLWAIGRVRPNTGWLPDSLLDEAGFVRVSPDLSVARRAGGVRHRRRRGHGPAARIGPQPGRPAARPQHPPPSGRAPAPQLPRPPSALGLGPGVPAGRAARVHAVGPVLPLPCLVDPDGPAALDRAARHLRRRPPSRVAGTRREGHECPSTLNVYGSSGLAARPLTSRTIDGRRGFITRRRGGVAVDGRGRGGGGRGTDRSHARGRAGAAGGADAAAGAAAGAVRDGQGRWSGRSDPGAAALPGRAGPVSRGESRSRSARAASAVPVRWGAPGLHPARRPADAGDAAAPATARRRARRPGDRARCRRTPWSRGGRTAPDRRGRDGRGEWRGRAVRGDRAVPGRLRRWPQPGARPGRHPVPGHLLPRDRATGLGDRPRLGDGHRRREPRGAGSRPDPVRLHRDRTWCVRVLGPGRHDGDLHRRGGDDRVRRRPAHDGGGARRECDPRARHRPAAGGAAADDSVRLLGEAGGHLPRRPRLPGGRCRAPVPRGRGRGQRGHARRGQPRVEARRDRPRLGATRSARHLLRGAPRRRRAHVAPHACPGGPASRARSRGRRPAGTLRRARCRRAAATPPRCADGRHRRGVCEVGAAPARRRLHDRSRPARCSRRSENGRSAA